MVRETIRFLAAMAGVGAVGLCVAAVLLMVDPAGRGSPDPWTYGRMLIAFVVLVLLGTVLNAAAGSDRAEDDRG